MSSTELAVRDEVNVAELRQTAQLLAASGYFEAKGSADQAIAQLATKILAGREMGFGPFASVNGIHIIQGKPTVSANLMAAAVKSSGRYDYRVRQMDDTAVSIEFFAVYAGKRESLGVSTFTMDDAKKAGTQNLQKFARNMLFARAMSNGVRWYTPDVFMAGGVYTPEEMGATVDGDTGEIIESTSRPVSPEPQRIPLDNGDVPFQPAPEAPRWATWKTPQEAYAWAATLGVDDANAKELMGIIVGRNGGRLTPKTMPTVFQEFWTEVQDGAAEVEPTQPTLDGVSPQPVYN